MKKERIIGFDVFFPEKKEELSILHEVKSGYYIFANSYTLAEAQKNGGLYKSLKEAKIIFPDGFPIVLAGRLKGLKKAERISGPDFTLNAISYLEKNKIKCSFFGGNNYEAVKREKILKIKFPKLLFSSFPESREEDMMKSIKKDKINHLFVSLGFPKQEIWANKNIKKIKINIYCIGIAIAYILGEKKRAPPFMRLFHLEWLYRLIKEPKHSWRRYLINGPKFLFLSIKEIINT